MKRNKLLIGVSIIGLFTITFLLAKWTERFFQIDSCLDRGGRWNYELNKCDFLPIDNLKQTQTENRKEKNTEHKTETAEFFCDSIYNDKGYKIILTKFDPKNDEENTKFNSIFELYKHENRQYNLIYSDSIFNTVLEVKFADYNYDNIKDILVQNYSDVRSNWTYYLYLLDSKNDKLIKIKGFENIKNPKFLTKYNLIDNYVNSGTNWTSFYEIRKDSVINYNIVVYDDLTENSTYKKDYLNAIKRILKDKTPNA